MPSDTHNGGKMACPNCSSFRIMGVSDGDSIGYWQCMACKHEWPRDGYFAELARENIDKMRAEGRSR